jgi:Ketol-acid reductoisomerase
MRVYYDRDADLNLIKDKKNSYCWIWKSRTCSCNELERNRY